MCATDWVGAVVCVVFFLRKTVRGVYTVSTCYQPPQLLGMLSLLSYNVRDLMTLLSHRKRPLVGCGLSGARQSAIVRIDGAFYVPSKTNTI